MCEFRSDVQFALVGCFCSSLSGAGPVRRGFFVILKETYMDIDRLLNPTAEAAAVGRRVTRPTGRGTYLRP